MEALKNNLICSVFVCIFSFASVAFAQLSLEEKLAIYVVLEDTERVGQFLERGVDPNVHNYLNHKGRSIGIDCFNLFNVTPLHCAARSGNTKMARLFIQYGVNVNIFVEGVSPFEIALDYGHTQIADMIVEAPTFDVRAVAIMFSNHRLDARATRRSPYLEAAIRNENARLIRVLLDKGGVSHLSFEDQQAMQAILRAYETTVVPADGL